MVNGGHPTSRLVQNMVYVGDARIPSDANHSFRGLLKTSI
nr:MAG TPA: hypothetical protein [Crassvirales sp.]